MFTVERLGDAPTAEIIADWQYREWGTGYPDLSQARFRSDVAAAIDSTAIPIVLVARLHNGQPVGTASLILDDLPSRCDLNPWMASVYVLPAYRRRGIAGQLILAVISEAERLGLSVLHLFTHDRMAFYQQFGWQAFDQAMFNGHPVTIMRRNQSITHVQAVTAMVNKTRYVDDAIRLLEQMGCEIEKTHNKHLKIYISLQGHQLIWVTSSTPSDVNAQKKSLATLRRLLRDAGFEPPKFVHRHVSETPELDRLWQLIEDAGAMTDEEGSQA